jgi:predicted transcriptional regulator of viral defense system
MSGTIKPRRTLGARESYLLSSLSAAGFTVFTVQDATAVLDERPETAHVLLSRLAAKGWLERLERGKYLILPLEAGPEGRYGEHEYLIAASLVQPYYLAYATALHHYGYTERRPPAIYIATTTQKQPLTVMGVCYRFVTLSQHKFFGLTQTAVTGQPVIFSDREKTVADCLGRPDLAGGAVEAAKALWFGQDELNLEQVIAYGQRMGNRAALRRLGFWLERLELGSSILLGKLEDRRGHSYAKLDTRGPASGPRHPRWRLIVNVPEKQLLEWREH